VTLEDYLFDGEQHSITENNCTLPAQKIATKQLTIQITCTVNSAQLYPVSFQNCVKSKCNQIHKINSSAVERSIQNASTVEKQYSSLVILRISFTSHII
jgi:hypothetical protein